MPASAHDRQDHRDSIIEAADGLFYREGFEHTSFADIAGAVRISRGNFSSNKEQAGQLIGAAQAAGA
jgi:AcrR family transcriptional regulator